MKRLAPVRRCMPARHASRLRHSRLILERLEERALLAIFYVNSTGDGGDTLPGNGVAVASADEFIGYSPPYTSEGALSLNWNTATFDWRSEDSILGSLDLHAASTTLWRVSGSNPQRLLFRGLVQGVSFAADLLLEPYSRGVIDLVRGSQRIRYLVNGATTLRSALEEANALPGKDEIYFRIPKIDQDYNAVDKVWTIEVGEDAAAPLPAATEPVAVDASTQPSATTDPVIVLRGDQAGANATGLQLRGGSSLVRGLVINNFDGPGIGIDTAGGNEIDGNFLGTSPQGNPPEPNQIGVLVDNTANNLIGTKAGNLVSGNNVAGVQITGAQATANVVQRSRIGTNKGGTAALGNGIGILIDQKAHGNQIGTNGDGVTDLEEGNVISGNAQHGVRIVGEGADQNIIAGNLIGVDKEGKAGLPNQQHGVSIAAGAKGTRIGSNGDGKADAAERNIISGNLKAGVFLFGEGTDGHSVAANLIGVAVDGKTAVANQGGGVIIAEKASSNLVGTRGDESAPAAMRNIISGNLLLGGVHLSGPGTSKNIVAGNLIGTAIDGSTAVPNDLNGVTIEDGASGNRIGTNGDSAGDAAERNLISGNKQHGVLISDAGSDTNVVAGNLIGLKSDGNSSLPNMGSGIEISSGAKANRIGTAGDEKAAAAMRNVISGNGVYGIALDGAGTDNNVVAGNLIGTNLAGDAAVGNEGNGVGVTNGPKTNRIGTNGDGKGDVAERNVISGNKFSGVLLSGANVDGNIVAGNFIGTKLDGNNVLGNVLSGVFVTAGAKSNRIGADGDGAGDAEERNIISGNQRRGVAIQGENTNSNIVAGNSIGIGFDGSSKVPNKEGGVEILQSAKSNRIGTNGDGKQDDSEANVIAANLGNGVLISDKGTEANTVAGNLIGLQRDGLAALDNELDGVRIAAGARLNVIGVNGDGSAGEANEGNVISGNKLNGLRITGEGTDSNVAAGNLIGLDKNGTKAVANQKEGILIEGKARLNRIGTDGNAAGDKQERNVIAGNKENGVRIAGEGTSENIVAGNLVGVQIDGTSSLPNEKNGVRIEDKASNNRIGSDGDGTGATDKIEGNVIAFNGTGFGASPLKGHGVVIASNAAVGNSVRLNSIHSNSGRGIDLGDDSFTINDAVGDKDTGPNNLQDYPVVRRVRTDAKNRTVTWMIDTNPDIEYYIDFYSNDVPDPSGFGEGKTYLQTVTAKTVASKTVPAVGQWQADIILPLGVTNISATATNRVTGDTSEFSMVDTDGDALADAWETQGIDFDETGNGKPGNAGIDLRLLDANINKLDIYVEVDAMDTAKLQPADADLKAVEDAFAAQNITLHARPLDDTKIPTAGWAADGWSGFDPVRAAWFGTDVERKSANSANILGAKRLTYRYGIFASQQGAKSTSGRGEIWGNDFMVTLGHKAWGGGSADEKRGTFMHELGHTMGLLHGGDESFVNFKPNYHSVMNYSWQVPHPGQAGWILDYSDAKLATLDESDLDETVGINAAAGHAKHEVPIGPAAALPWAWTRLIPERGAVDWDTADGKVGTNPDAKFDINDNGNTKDVFTGFNDWAVVPDYLYFVELRNYAPGNHQDGACGCEIAHDDELEAPPEGGRGPMELTGSLAERTGVGTAAEPQQKLALVIVGDVRAPRAAEPSAEHATSVSARPAPPASGNPRSDLLLPALSARHNHFAGRDSFRSQPHDANRSRAGTPPVEPLASQGRQGADVPSDGARQAVPGDTSRPASLIEEPGLAADTKSARSNLAAPMHRDADLPQARSRVDVFARAVDQIWATFDAHEWLVVESDANVFTALVVLGLVRARADAAEPAHFLASRQEKANRAARDR